MMSVLSARFLISYHLVSSAQITVYKIQLLPLPTVPQGADFSDSGVEE